MKIRRVRLVERKAAALCRVTRRGKVVVGVGEIVGVEGILVED